MNHCIKTMEVVAVLCGTIKAESLVFVLVNVTRGSWYTHETIVTNISDLFFQSKNSVAIFVR